MSEIGEVKRERDHYKGLYEQAVELLKRWQYNDTTEDQGESDATSEFLAGHYAEQAS